MRRGRIVVVAGLFGLSPLLASSCAGKGGPGDSCSSTDDCTQPSDAREAATIACVLGRCHFQCTSSGFCGTGSACVIVQGTDFCTLPDEAACVPGGAGSTCPSPLACGADDECRTPCTSGSDCLPSGQACAKGVCVDVIVSADAGQDSGG